MAIKTPDRAAFWRQHLENFRASGLTRGAFCRQHGLKAHKAAGVEAVTPHELRHSCTEIWVTFGASREDISRVLNQSSQAVVDRYMHRTHDRTAQIASTIMLPETLKVAERPVLKIVR